MFTGVIEKVSSVREVKKKDSLVRVTIDQPAGWKFASGQSIAVDGTCSTITTFTKKNFTVEYMPETVRKTTASAFQKGTVVNLERPLTLQSFVDGHLVQGHVDERAEVHKVTKGKREYQVTLAVSKKLSRYIAEHGSIAINGVSLTVARKKSVAFTVSIIPYTLRTTNLGRLKKGDSVNVEVDMVARYLEALKQ